MEEAAKAAKLLPLSCAQQALVGGLGEEHSTASCYRCGKCYDHYLRLLKVPLGRTGNGGIQVSKDFQKMKSSTTTAHALREHTLK